MPHILPLAESASHIHKSYTIADIIPIMKIKKVIKLGESDDARLVGGKAHALSDLIKAGFTVPEGFVVTTIAFHKITPELETEILYEFDRLDSEFVAVRSSAVAEDSIEAAWAGQLDTYLNVTKDKLLASIRKCQDSAKSDRAKAYARGKSLDSGEVGVVIQKMVQGEVSGVAFSAHPITGDKGQTIIEAGFGLGEAVVSGQITPDSYIFDKTSQEILEKHVSRQTKQLIKSRHGGDIWQDLSKEGESQKLSDGQIKELGNLVSRIEKYFGFPVDVEWTVSDGKLYILQSRPITTLSQ